MEEPALGLVALARALYPRAQYGLQVTELGTEGEDGEGEHSERRGGDYMVERGFKQLRANTVQTHCC